jgi:integrase
MSLRKVGKIWVYRCKVNGRTWSRTTEEADKRKALAKIPHLENLAQLHREQPVKSVKLSRAIVAEVQRVESDVSPASALRVHHCLKNFLKWLGQDIELSKIDTDLVERFQRERLKKASVNTVNRELYAICAMLRENKYRVDKPKFKPGRKTEQRDFNEEELRMFFEACDQEQGTLFSFLLATGARPAEVIPSVRSTHIALLKKEIDLEAGTVTIRSAKLKPNQKASTRVIKIGKELMDRLEAQANEQRDRTSLRSIRVLPNYLTGY